MAMAVLASSSSSHLVPWTQPACGAPEAPAWPALGTLNMGMCPYSHCWNRSGYSQPALLAMLFTWPLLSAPRFSPSSVSLWKQLAGGGRQEQHRGEYLQCLGVGWSSSLGCLSGTVLGLFP